MASRKTYFGIGLPKDPTDPGTGPGGRDPSADFSDDRSAPTVVDDEKVAEGLRQLRSWYQGDAQARQPSTAAPARVAPPASIRSAASHGAADRGRATRRGRRRRPARPMAPDPMRATMYGHDIHSSIPTSRRSGHDADAATAAAATAAAATADAATADAAGASTALVVADPAVRLREMMYRQQAEAQGAAVRSTQMPFQLAGHGEAQRLVRPGGQKPTP